MPLVPCILISVVLSSRPDLESAICALLGTADIQEVNQPDYEQFENLYRHPLQINSASRKQLTESGLFSTYQVESLLDYISRNSFILSPTELSSVDGFTPRSAPVLAPFLDFSTDVNPASDFSLQADVGAGIKIQKGEGTGQWYGKCSGSYASWWGTVGASVAAKPAYDRPLTVPSSVGWTASYEGKYGGLCGGYFNARYGQGLIQWSGFVSSNNLANPSSLMKRPMGITPYTSYSTLSAMYGVAGHLDFRHFSCSAFADFQCSSYGGNASYLHRNGEIGISVTGGSGDLLFSVDFQQTLKGNVLYGEAALSLQTKYPVILLGSVIPIDAFVVGPRISFSKKEHNAIVSTAWLSSDRRHDLSSGISVSFHPQAHGNTPAGAAEMKILAVYCFSPLAFLSLTSRINCRMRSLTKYSETSAPYASSWSEMKIELREDLKWDDGSWLAALRLDLQHCSGMSYLTYLEGGRKGGMWALYLQAGYFSADSWADRMYVYQRDAPPSFNMKALYGHGMLLSCFASLSIGRHVKLYARAGYVGYLKPMSDQQDKDRPSADARLQCSVEF